VTIPTADNGHGGSGSTPIADISALFAMYQAGLVFHGVCAITRLGVADALAEGPRPLGELAAEINVDPDALRRVLRLLAGHGYIAFSAPGAREGGGGGGGERAEDRDDEVALIGPGLLLSGRHPASLGATFATLGISDVAHALDEVIRTGRPACPGVLGEGFWEYLARRPKEQAVFSSAMAEQAQLLSLPCVDLLDWPDTGTIVDVAGGTGILLAAVLETAPGARGILLDQPQVLGRAGALLAEAGVADRCDLRPGDLFAPPPPAELYLLSRVLHDWDDEHVVRILRTLAAGAGAPGASAGRPSLRIFEDLLPQDGLPTAVQCWSDVVMMALYDGARERTLADFEKLLDRGGWRLERAVAGPPGINVIEAVLRDSQTRWPAGRPASSTAPGGHA
jgi:O-methyltransferase domain